MIRLEHCLHGDWVYWKGIQIDHHSFRDKKEQAKVLARLEKRCLHLEAIGVPVSCTHVIWCWDWFKTMTVNEPFKEFLIHCGTLYENDDGCLATELGGRVLGWCPFAPGWYDMEVPDCECGCGKYHKIVEMGFTIANCGQGENLGTCFATLAGLKTFFAKIGFKPEHDGWKAYASTEPV